MLALGVFSADTTYAEPHLKLPILRIDDANLSVFESRTDPSVFDF